MNTKLFPFVASAVFFSFFLSNANADNNKVQLPVISFVNPTTLKPDAKIDEEKLEQLSVFKITSYKISGQTDLKSISKAIENKTNISIRSYDNRPINEDTQFVVLNDSFKNKNFFDNTLKAISDIVTVTNVSKQVLLSVANEPVHYNSGEQSTYIKSIEHTNKPNNIQTTTITPDTIKESIDLDLRLRKMDDHKNRLYFILNSYSLEKLVKMKVDDNEIEEPDITE
jgi:hypothetical protein